MKKNTIPYLLLSFAGVIAIFLWMHNQGEPLGKKGILPLEFAYTQEKVEQVMLQWSGVLDVARTNIYIDFLFIIAYVAFLSLACKFFAAKTTGKWSAIGTKLSQGAIIAGVFDVAENALMLTSLQGTPNNMTAMITTTFAALKFAIAAVAVLYIVISIPLSLVSRRSS